jgi:beta-galactosidase
MQTHYVVPQENGCRMQTRWAHLGLDQPLRVSSAEPATFTVRPWSTDALTAARHADELREERVVWMHWGAGIDGLGSAACGAAPSPQATFRFRTARLELEFEPVGT